MASIIELGLQTGVIESNARFEGMPACGVAHTLRINGSGRSCNLAIGCSAWLALSVATTVTWGQATSSDKPSRVTASPAQDNGVKGVASLFRFEPTGLSLLQPYSRGKIPVIL